MKTLPALWTIVTVQPLSPGERYAAFPASAIGRLVLARFGRLMVAAVARRVARDVPQDLPHSPGVDPAMRGTALVIGS